MTRRGRISTRRNWYERNLAVIAAEAERVADWVEEHSYVFLWLVLGQRRSERNRLGNRGVEVADLEVEVHHRSVPHHMPFVRDRTHAVCRQPPAVSTDIGRGALRGEAS